MTKTEKTAKTENVNVAFHGEGKRTMTRKEYCQYKDDNPLFIPEVVQWYDRAEATLDALVTIDTEEVAMMFAASCRVFNDVSDEHGGNVELRLFRSGALYIDSNYVINEPTAESIITILNKRIVEQSAVVDRMNAPLGGTK